MPLKLSLKPGEKFVLNGAVLANGDKRTSLVIQNKACVLREKDIMQPKDAKTPARLVYLAIMMMYLEGENSGGADGAHELGHAQGKFVVGLFACFALQIHQHDGQIDAPRRSVGVFRLHDVLFAQDTGLVLDHQAGALVTVGQNRAIEHEFLARL